MARLTADFLVKAMLRRVHDAGGSGMVLSRGDSQSGTILVLALERGANPRFFERGFGDGGAAALIQTGPKDESQENADLYWRRRVSRDPDLWVVELDIAAAERFAAETIALN